MSEKPSDIDTEAAREELRADTAERAGKQIPKWKRVFQDQATKHRRQAKRMKQIGSRYQE